MQKSKVQSGHLSDAGDLNLTELPAGLTARSLDLSGCTSLTELPEGLDVYFLDISGCTGLQSWPREASVRVGRLNARGCAQLTTLPSWLTYLAQLDIRGCANLTHLPDGFTVGAWLDIADSGIQSLPSLSGVQLTIVLPANSVQTRANFGG